MSLQAFHSKLPTKWLVPLFFSLVSLAVVGPWLGRGFILTLDMVFVPELRMPEQVGSSYLFHALLYALNQVIAADVLQKIILFAVFWLAGWGAWRLSGLTVISDGWQQMVGRAVAGVFYTINPFTYERLMAGQYAVLLGYALLPWFVVSLVGFLRRPAWMTAAQLSTWVLAVSIVSVHTLGAVGVVTIIGLVGVLLGVRYRRFLQRYAVLLTASLVAVLTLSSYWLIPLTTGHSEAAQQISTFTDADRQAFATSGNGLIEKVWHVLQLRGFWAERYGLFALPWQQLGLVWHFLSLAFMVLVAAGLVGLWRRQRLVAGVLLACIVSGAAVGSGLVTDLLGGSLGILDGYREPQKFTALVALGYAGTLAAGATTALHFWSGTFTSRPAVIGASFAILALPLLWTSTLLWGAHGQLKPRQYPAGWFVVNDALNQQPAGQTLFLPWHLYFQTKFANRVIANPAPLFFDRELVVSRDPELAGASIGPDAPLQARIDRMLQDKSASAITELQQLGVRYVVVAHENDYQDHAWITQQPGVTPVTTTDSISLYRLQEDN